MRRDGCWTPPPLSAEGCGQQQQEIQKVLVFLLQKHWLPKDVIYLLVDDGGQSLIDIDSRIKAFILEYLRDVIYKPHYLYTFLNVIIITLYIMISLHMITYQ